MHKYLRFLLMALLIFAVLMTPACKKKDSDKDLPIISIDPDPEPDPEPKPVPKGITNPVTGLEMATDYVLGRPIAIMLNNLKSANPQKGIGQYDMLFEIVAEVPITRFIGVFYDYRNIPNLGSVRSMREYFMKVALPVDPIIIHYGGSPQAYQYIKENKIDNLDGINGNVDAALFYRDADRIKTAGLEHSAFTTSKKILTSLEKFKIRTSLKSPNKMYFDFSEVKVKGTEPAPEVMVKFSKSYAGTFKYDEASGLYKRFQFGAPHIDGETKEQLTAKNIFIIQTKVKAVSGDTSGRQDVTTNGTGKGYYITEGTKMPIKWEKKSDTEFYTFTTEDGKTLQVNAGKMWMCVIDERSTITFEEDEKKTT